MAVLALPMALGVTGARAETTFEVYNVPTVGDATIRVEILRDPAFDPQPILLTHSPYNINADMDRTVNPRFDNLSDRYVPRGFARAWADVLGTRGSGGCWNYGGKDEQQAGVDVVNYLADLDWSNGKVAMIGVSYDGTTATEVAVRGEEVPGLAAIVPQSAIARWYDYAYTEGARHTIQSGTPLVFDVEYGRSPGMGYPPDERSVPATLARTGECGAVEHTMRAYDDAPVYDEFWLERDYLKDAAKIRVPVLLTHGWQDYNVKQEHALKLWAALGEDDPDTEAVEGPPLKILYMFQGGHQAPVGEMWQPLLDRFFDETLRGIDTGLSSEPPVVTENAGSGVLGFRVEASFPPPETDEIVLSLSRTDGGGALGVGSPAGPPATFLALPGGTFKGPSDGTISLLYVSPPLAHDVRLAGSAVLDAVVSVDRPRAQLDALLVDIEPDGLMGFVAPGWLNLRYRHGEQAPEAIPPGEPVAARVTIKPQDYSFAAGNRIGLIVHGADPGNVLPDIPGAAITVHHGLDGSASVLRLPLVSPPAELFATG